MGECFETRMASHPFYAGYANSTGESYICPSCGDIVYFREDGEWRCQLCKRCWGIGTSMPVFML